MKRYLLIMILFFAVFKSYAEEPLRIGIGDWPPFMFADPDNPRGISIDLTRSIAERLGAEYEFYILPWARTQLMLNNGTLDLTPVVAKNPERDLYLYYSDRPYTTVSNVFYVRKGRAGILRNYEDLYNLKIGVAAKSEYFDPFNKDTEIDKYAAVREEQLLLLLANDRVDAVIGTYPQIAYHISLLGLTDQFEMADYRPENDQGIYLGISKKSPWAGKMEHINRILADIMESGEYGLIVESYFEK